MKTDNKFFKKNSNRSGFLLVEMLVAVFLFTIVMLVSLTAVLALVDANKKNQNIKSVVNNLTLVVNGIVKNIAVSTKYYCGAVSQNTYLAGDYTPDDSDCTAFVDSGGNIQDPAQSEIAFTFNEDTNNDGELDVFRYKFVTTEQGVDEDGGAIDVGRIYRSVDSDAPEDFLPVTAPEVKITSVRFYVYDTEPLNFITGTPSDTKQPRVVMIVVGYAGQKDSTRSRFHVQTTISQRTLDTI